MINCTLIGYGKWGKNIFDVLKKERNLKIKSICKKNINDFDKSKFKGDILKSYKKAINNNIDVVFIASPSETHFQIAKYALEKKKGVFVEKPVCLKNSDYIKLKKLANKYSLTLHVDYIHLYNENLIELVKKTKMNKKTLIEISLGNNG